MAIFLIFTDSRAVAGRLLKGCLEVAEDISLCLLPFVTLPVPNLALLWPSFVFYASLCALFMCVLSYCILVHGQYWGLMQAGCSVKQSHFKEIALNI